MVHVEAPTDFVPPITIVITDSRPDDARGGRQGRPAALRAGAGPQRPQQLLELKSTTRKTVKCHELVFETSAFLNAWAARHDHRSPGREDATMQALSVDQLAQGVVAVMGNAEDLLRDARILIDHHRAPRAYALAREACEEIAKAVILACTLSRMFLDIPIDWQKLEKRLRGHTDKSFMSGEVGLRVRASQARKQYLRSASPGQILDAEILFPLTSASQADARARSALRARAINSDFDGESFKLPSELVTLSDARAAVAVAVEQVDYARHLYKPSSAESVVESIAHAVQKHDELVSWCQTAIARGLTLPALFYEMVRLEGHRRRRVLQGSSS